MESRPAPITGAELVGDLLDCPRLGLRDAERIAAGVRLVATCGNVVGAAGEADQGQSGIEAAGIVIFRNQLSGRVVNTQVSVRNGTDPGNSRTIQADGVGLAGDNRDPIPILIAAGVNDTENRRADRNAKRG